ncbi:hypothetical protein NDU88_006278 [Pleurodeles waltl]|uniref:Uncharacterized protein n=1 Tax=Pleurodeles waltl TaxID=8319 RepID=A0AAV7MYQ9_PLEWA|nr:hypothetical protein NDU88_006278 [Pleurodeles waltl]
MTAWFFLESPEDASDPGAALETTGGRVSSGTTVEAPRVGCETPERAQEAPRRAALDLGDPLWGQVRAGRRRREEPWPRGVSGTRGGGARKLGQPFLALFCPTLRSAPPPPSNERSWSSPARADPAESSTGDIKQERGDLLPLSGRRLGPGSYAFRRSEAWPRSGSPRPFPACRRTPPPPPFCAKCGASTHHGDAGRPQEQSSRGPRAEGGATPLAGLWLVKKHRERSPDSRVKRATLMANELPSPARLTPPCEGGERDGTWYQWGAAWWNRRGEGTSLLLPLPL